jgi:hypothetical protein
MRLGDNVSKLQSDGADTIRRKRCCHQFNHEGDSIKEVLLRWYVNPMLLCYEDSQRESLGAVATLKLTNSILDCFIQVRPR